MLSMSSKKSNMTRMRINPKIYDYCYFTTSINIRLIDTAIKKIDDTKNYTVVDIGCGEKPFYNKFKGDFKYIGIDFSSHSSADIVCDIKNEIPVEKNTADFIILSEVLEHLPNPFSIISEIERILKPEGILFISTPFAFPIHARPHDYFRFTENFYIDLQNQYSFTLVDLGKSNTIFSTPIVIFANIIQPLPYVPYFAKQFLWLLMNITVLVIDYMTKIFSNTKRNTGFLYGLPVGYAAVFVKN
jgi:SAM-dependent methyltransferase